MALQENQIDVGSMINVDYVGPNYKTPDSNSWKDYTNPLECLTQLTTTSTAHRYSFRSFFSTSPKIGSEAVLFSNNVNPDAAV